MLTHHHVINRSGLCSYNVLTHHHVINRSGLCSYNIFTHHHVINRSGLCSYHILTHQSRHQRVRSVQLQPTDSPVTPPTVTPTDPVCPATVAFSPFMSSRATAREPAEDRTLSVGTTASADTMTLPALKVSVTKLFCRPHRAENSSRLGVGIAREYYYCYYYYYYYYYYYSKLVKCLPCGSKH